MTITKDVTLVLGAGASVPYHFPSGRRLVVEAQALAGGDADRFGLQPGNLTHFVKELERSRMDSIDAFLEYRAGEPGIVETGKAVIAGLLIPHEYDYNLRLDQDPGTKWYDYLWRMLRGPREEWDNNRLRIVTYNYDRSLEFYLWTAISATYRVGPDEARQMFSRIPFVHVHGTLGQFTPISTAGVGGTPAYTREYTQRMTTDEIFIGQKSIKVIHEDIDTTPELESAREMIRSSRKVVFLGFGYHRRNVERLRLPEHVSDECEVWGTIGTEITASELTADIKPLFAGLDPNRCRLFNSRRQSDARQFLKTHRELFAA